jgi:heavy metal sensor kinase
MSSNRVPIRWRLTLWFIGVLELALLGFSLLLYFTLQNNLSTRINDTLDLRANQVQYEVNSDVSDTVRNGHLPDPTTLAKDLQLGLLQEFAEPGVYVQILDLQGKPLTISPNLAGNQLPVDPTTVVRARNGTKSTNEIRVGDERLRILNQPLKANDQIIGVLQVAESLQPFYDTIDQVRWLLGVGNVLTLVVATLGGWWLVGRALRPVVQVTQTAQKIALTRRFDERIPLKGNNPKANLDEIGQLAATFNRMIEEISRVFENNRQFMADTSHELRTPLTVIRGNLNLLRRGLDKTEAEEAIAEADEEAVRLSHLVNDLLMLAQADAEQVIEFSPVQLDEVMHRVTRRAEQIVQAQHKVLKVELERNDSALVMGDEIRLSQAINNLVENAIRYTPDEGKVTLNLKNESGLALITVADTGIGIAPEHLAHLFERFYRVDKARSRALGGTGLGLAIVKYLTEAHGGQVRVESEPGKGSLFEIRLPLAQKIN